MISRIIHFSISHRIAVIILVSIASILGWIGFRNLPIDAVPDITNIQVQINTSVNGLSPEETERNVTFPIETAMQGIADVTQVRSLTRFNLSQVTVVFEDSVDIYRARQLVSERLQTLSGALPSHMHPTLGPVSSGLGEIYHYTIEPTTKAMNPEQRFHQLMKLREIQEWFIRPRLLTVKGVADVNTIGGLPKQFHIQPNIRKMAHYGLHFSDLATALEKSNQNVGGGYIQQSTEQFLVQAVGLFKTLEDIRSVPVRILESFQTITIGDIADVKIATELRSGAALVQGQESVIGTVMMLLGENSRAVAIRVSERLKEISQGLPPEFKIKTLYNRSNLVNSTLKTVEHNLVTGAILVIIVLTLLVGNLRAAFITSIIIPITLLISFIVMRRLDISGNLMSLGALDFGIIVDGTVILLDHCVRVIQEQSRHKGRPLSSDEIKQSIYNASVQIRKAAGFGELIIIVVFLPIFALIGTEGKMFRPMAATFIIAISIALLLSFTLAPALASFLLNGKTRDQEPWIMKKLEALYIPSLKLAIGYPKLVAIGALSTILAGGFLFSQLGGEFLPQLNEGSTLIQCTRPVNTNLDHSIAMQSKTQQIVSSFPEVELTFSKIGTAEIANDPMGVNEADNYIIYKDESQWPKQNGKHRTKDEVATTLLKRLNAEIPGQTLALSQPIQMRFDDLLEGSKSDVSVKVFGDNMGQLASITREIAQVIEQVQGASEVQVELRGTSPLLRITPNQAILKKLGVSTSELLEAVGIALGGQVVGNLYEGIKRFPIIIRLKEQDRSNLEAIKNLPVGILSNTTLPLHKAAHLEFVNAYGAISREQGKRRAAVMVNPRGRDTESFVLEAQKKVAEKVQLPTGYFLEWSGTFKNLKEAKSRLLVLAPLALLLVLMMTYAAFNNLTQAILIFSCIPLALVGGVLGLVLNHLPFSISAGVGFIALSGIAVLNGIVLMNCYNDLIRHGKHGRSLIIEGALLRLRPVLMTALVDIFGFLPMMLSHGAGSEVQKPLASVIIGGILSSTLLTLIVLPTFCEVLEKYFKKSN